MLPPLADYRQFGAMFKKVGLISLMGFLLLLYVTASLPAGSAEAGSSLPPGVPTASERNRALSSRAIALTPDDDTLLVVNPDSDSLSIVDLANGNSVTEIGLAGEPRTVALDRAGARAYVANRGSHTVSVIDVAARQLIATIPVGYQPHGVVVSTAANAFFVAEQGSDSLSIFSLDTLELQQRLALPDRPSGLALSPDETSLYVTHLFANEISVIPVALFRQFLPAIVAGSGQRAASRAWNQPPAVASIQLWPDSNLVQAIVIAPDGARAYVPHTRSNSVNGALTLDTTLFPIVSLIDLETEQHLIGQQFNLEIIDPPAVGLPFDAAFSPDGAELWVLNGASNDISVIDVSSRGRLAHIEVGANPRGIVINGAGDTAYVNNSLDGTVSIIDTASYSVTRVLTVTDIPLDPTLLAGKRLFHSSDDPRMGRNQWMSCNSCHFDGEHDGRTWQLGFAGPRNTTSLLGLSGTFPLRWSGEWDEAADAEFAIRMDSFGLGLIDGPMHCSLNPPDCVNQPPHAGVSADLDALSAYIQSLTRPLHPDHANGEPLSAQAARGQLHFHNQAVGCASCHQPPHYTDNLAHDVGTATASELIGPAFNTPSLLGLYNSFPYFHDGSAPDIFAAITRQTPGNEHNVSGQLTAIEIEELVAFLLALPFE